MKEVTEKEFWETVQRTGEIKRSFSHPIVEFFSLQRIQYMKKFLNFDSIRTALDVGCGTGVECKLSRASFNVDIQLLNTGTRNLNAILA